MQQSEADDTRHDQGERAEQHRSTFQEAHAEMVRAWSVTGLAARDRCAMRAARLPEWGCAESLLVLLLIVVVAAIAVGVLYVTRGPSRSNMVLGLQDDALLTSAEPLAVPTVTGARPRR